MKAQAFTTAVYLSALFSSAVAIVTQKCGDDYCKGTIFNTSLLDTYVCGDPRLGPVHLPTRFPLDTLLEVYDRFGGLCPGSFLETWYNATDTRCHNCNVTDPSCYSCWIYPHDIEHQDGFALNTENKTITGEFTLHNGTLIDRFGAESGSYVSPAGAPYMQRALPPYNLDTPPDNPQFPNNYHVYRVLKPFPVTAGPIAPCFGQPGQGVQYKLKQHVDELIKNKTLESVDPSTIF